MVSGSLIVYKKPQPQQSSGNSGNGGGNDNSQQPQQPQQPPAETQQPSNDDEGAVAGDVVDGIVV